MIGTRLHGGYDRGRVLDALNHLAAWRCDDRSEWIRVGMALHSIGDEMLDVWIAWSEASDRFNERECRRQWRMFRRRSDGITVGSLFKAARDDGWRPRRGRGVRVRLNTRRTRHRKPEPAPSRPPERQVQAVWETCTPVTEDDEAAAYLSGRGIDPARAEDRDLVRALPRNAPLPSWTRIAGRTWAEGQYRIITRLYGADGEPASLHARRITSGDPKSASPSGFQIGGLVMADPLGQLVLRDGAGDPLWVYVVEGFMDFVTAGVIPSEADVDAPAVIGLINGSWHPSIARRVPPGSRISVATHDDEAGERYANQVIESFGRGYDIRRVLLGGAA